MVGVSGNTNQESGNMNTLDPKTVHDIVHRKGTKIATVQFFKKDGSLRTINGHFRATSHMVGGDLGQAQHDRLRANGLVAIYSFKDRGWRSFSADRVSEIR
jgi:hypothetical protein